MNWTLVILLAALLLIGLWTLVPVLAGLPWRAAAPERIRRALRLAQVRPGETVYDLGAGDGRVLFVAAGEFGARAIGVEISPLHCLLVAVRARLTGAGAQVRVRLGNFYTADLHDADVVLAYMTSAQSGRLRPHLEHQLRPGARVVTIAFELDGWRPDAFDREAWLCLYRMPAGPGKLDDLLLQNISG